jgi:very-short-patch-repair endonuclease
VRPKSFTPQENLIAKVLDETGLRYARQVPIGNYTVDFLITEMNVIIEADGPFGHLAKRDAKRDADLIEMGFEEVWHLEEKTYKDIKDRLWQELKL